MSEIVLVILLSCFALMSLAVGLACILTLRSIATAGLRAGSREQRVLYHLVERLVERRDHSHAQGVDLARIHASERTREVAEEAETERTLGEKPSPPKPEPILSISPEDQLERDEIAAFAN
jgi:hypothetical protein